MPPVLVFALGTQRGRLVHYVVVNRDVEGAVAVARVGAPRVVNMEHASRVKAFPLRPDRKRHIGIKRRAVHIDGIARRQSQRKINDGFAIRRHGIPWGLVTDKIGALGGIRRHHRRSNRTVEPPALRCISGNKAHQYGIGPEKHLRQGLVTPWALEPHYLGSRSHEGLLIRSIRLRIEPELRFRTEKLAHLELVRAPRDTVVLVVVVIRGIRAGLDIETHPVLEIGKRLPFPCVGEPSVTVACHHRPGIRAKTGVVVTTRTAQNMRHIVCPCSIVTPWGLKMQNKVGPCRGTEQEKQTNTQTHALHTYSFSAKPNNILKIYPRK